MDFEELNDMAIAVVEKKGLSKFKATSLVKSLKKSKDLKEAIANNIIVMMYLSNQFKFNLEDVLLNKIEAMHRKWK